MTRLPIHSTQLVASEIPLNFAHATLPVLEELRGNVRGLTLSPLCHHLARPPAKQQHVRDSMVLQVKVLAVSQDGLAPPPALCEALSKLFALSLCDLPTCEMRITIVVIIEGCHEKSRTNVSKVLRVELWRTVSTQ